MAEPSVNRFGLTEVYKPSEGECNVDVVFVHGLNGDPHNTWTAENSKIFWPYQLLPPLLEKEKARILVYGYDADVATFTDGASKDAIHNHAESLVAQLAANRRIRKANERPIIFVVHSLGGLVVKRALIYSSEIRGNHTEHLRSIFVSTYGILFLGTPHKGADLAKWGSRLEAIASAVMPKRVFDSNDKLVNALKKENETLQEIDRQFIQIIDRFRVYFFHEGKPTNLKGTLQFIVDEESASPTVQDVERAVIQADHSHMCKFESDSAPGFDLVAEGIQRYAEEAQAPTSIARRWQWETAERTAKKVAEVEEILPGHLKQSPNTESTGTTPDTSSILPPRTSSQPSLKLIDDGTNTDNNSAIESRPKDPYFIVPPGFRPNNLFIGLDKEFVEMDKRLFGKRRRDGTACVLLWGQAGGGKSHLARQYVNKRRDRFEGGIFWMPARSEGELRHAFSSIKQKVISRDSPGLCDGVDDNDLVQLVREWFESRQEWLIVFDGVTVQNDDDLNMLASFVPDSKNSSIIYISRAKNLESKQRLLRPMPIKVGPLKEEDAKKLLFKELKIKKPSPAEDRKATELVKHIGGLPLAINAIRCRLADTHEPLTKYNLSYSADPTLESTYNQILDDLQRLGHMEAWNLISILCWFAQDLPFEMVNLGLKILRTENVEVRETEGTGKPDIDNTIAVLMRYALLERNEPDDRESMSSSRDSLNQPEPIDMLKVHTVVQNFCCEQLYKRGLLPTWLGYAAKLFSFSYHQADIRIKSKPEPGRVSDYRYYETHGKWLWNQTLHYDKKQSLEAIRALLNPTLERIGEEIKQREPGSSQESLGRGIFQISIFDRTSSSSDSGPMGPPTPDTRPTPPPLAGETDFGFPVGKAMDSPASFGTASPGIRPKIVGQSPRLPSYEDGGYDSDREGDQHRTPMQRNISEMTALPSTRSRAPTTESHGGEWQVVQKPKKQPRKRRDLGSFRPRPASVKVNKQTVNAAISQSGYQQKENRRGSSQAFEALEKVHSQSPPRSRAGVASLLPHNPFNRPSTTTPSQPTWANITAGVPRPPVQQDRQSNMPIQAAPSPAPIIMDRGRSPKARPGSSGTNQPSPLASSFAPGGARIEEPHPNPPLSETYPPTAMHYSTPYPGSSASLATIPQSQPLDTTSAIPPYYTPAPPFGQPNPSPLPYIDQATLTTKRPLPSEFTTPPQQQQQISPAYSSPHSTLPSPPSRQTSPYTHPQSVSPPYPPVILPSGYTSQPMSRNQSHLSHSSIAESEPPRYGPMPYSPQLMPTYPPGSSEPYPQSPRDRGADGRPLRKSPKTDYSVPVAGSYPPYQPSPPPPRSPYQQPSQRVSPQYPPPSVTTPLTAIPAGPYNYNFDQPDPDAAAAMSRSSSGPGLAVEGSIVSFSDPNEVQFGEHRPISIEEARRRMEGERLRQAQGQENGRRRSAPDEDGVGLGVDLGQ